MTDYAALQIGAAKRGLTLLGGFTDDNRTTLLLGPDPQDFWPILQTAPEARHPDPVDRWSTRIIGDWAADLGAQARFPFGTPLHPFITWARRTGRWQSGSVPGAWQTECGPVAGGPGRRQPGQRH